MNRHTLLVAMVTIIGQFVGLAQNSDADNGSIVIGTVNRLYSEILQEEREVWIHVPKRMDSTKKYPVIYVLDASQHFHVITGMLTRLVPMQIPESIVVGIVNTDRIRDFTPTNVAFSRGHDTKNSGGAANFLTFFNDELKPYISQKFPTEGNTTIIGHSTAGLFVLYSYLENEASFDNYLAIDPSLWWDKENLVKKSQKLLEKGDRKEKSLYVGVANSIGKRMDTVKVRKETSEPTEQIRANLNFHDVLVANQSKLTSEWEYFKNEDHGGITVPAQFNGLRSLFSWYPFRELYRFNTPKRYSAKELTEPFIVHYKSLSTRMKREVKPDWQLVNDVGFFMLEGHNLPKKALAYLEMNVHFYPNESKTYVALGDFYAARKMKELAKKNYRRAVAIDRNKEAKSKLEDLEK